MVAPLLLRKRGKFFQRLAVALRRSRKLRIANGSAIAS